MYYPLSVYDSFLNTITHNKEDRTFVEKILIKLYDDYKTSNFVSGINMAINDVCISNILKDVYSKINSILYILLCSAGVRVEILKYSLSNINDIGGYTLNNFTFK